MNDGVQISNPVHNLVRSLFSNTLIQNNRIWNLTSVSSVKHFSLTPEEPFPEQAPSVWTDPSY